MTGLTTIMFIMPIIVLVMYVHNELRIYKKGGDVYDWVKRLATLIASIRFKNISESKNEQH